MPLDIGDWTINVAKDSELIFDGAVGTLTINSVDGQGNVSGSVFGDPIQGKWDETSQSIALATVAKPMTTFYSGKKTGVWLSGAVFELNTGGQGSLKRQKQFSVGPMVQWYAQPGCG